MDNNTGYTAMPGGSISDSFPEKILLPSLPKGGHWTEVPFSYLLGCRIEKITGAHKDSSEVEILTRAGNLFRMLHHQDCCESVWLEDVCGDIDDLIGEELISVEEAAKWTEGSNADTEQWTFYTFKSKKGVVVLRWCGVSHYYSTDVVLEKFMR